MTDPSVRITIIDPGDTAARAALSAYFAEVDRLLAGGFDQTSALIAADDDLRGDRGALLAIYRDDELLAAGGVKTPAGEPALLKRMWTSPQARGLGLGRRLLTALEDVARDRGATLIRLDTNSVMTAAIALYRSAGFVEVDDFNGEPHADLWFAKPL